MSYFRQKWTPRDAEEWTKEDYWGMVFSSLSYVFFTIGPGLCFLLPLWGVLCVALGFLFLWLMNRAVDAKLTAISSDYEAKQKQYLEHLDRVMKWEEE